MKCEHCIEHLPEYVGRAMAERSSAAIEAHLETCVACRESLTEWTLLRTALERSAATRAAVPPRYMPPASPLASPPAIPPAPPRYMPPTSPLASLPAIPPAPRSAPVGGSAPAPVRIRRAAVAAAGFAIAAIAFVILLRSPMVVERGPGAPAGTAAVGTAATGTAAPQRVVSERATAIPRAPTAIGRRYDQRAMPPGVDGVTAGASAAAPLSQVVDASNATRSTMAIAPATPAPLIPAPASSAPETPIPATSPPESTPAPESTTSPEPPAASPETPSMPEPTHIPIVTGLITGHVLGPDGRPRAEIWVVAERAAGPADEAWTFTGVDGRYQLELDPDAWIVRAESAAHPLMWHPGQLSPFGASATRVDAGAVIEISFHLESRPSGMISGTVTDAGGAPFERALVVAAFPPAALGDPPRPAVAAFSGAGGRFEIPIAPGVWLVAASPSSRGENLSWWGGDSAAAAERLVVRQDEAGPALELRLDP